MERRLDGEVFRNGPVRVVSFLYNLAVSATVWVLLVPCSLVQITLGRSSRLALDERLGRRVADPSPNRRRLLIHAVSVGEVKVVEPLLEALSHRMEGLEVVLSTGNRDGYETAQRLRRCRPEIREVCYLPWDRARTLRRWLAHLRPRAVIVVETELWPNLFLTCRNLGIPLAIVNGRIYRRDVARYRLVKRFFRPVLGCVGWIGVQSKAERDRFSQIGADLERIHVVGNLKFDCPPQRKTRLGIWERSLSQSRPLLVAGSTHRPEERWLLEVFQELRRDAPALRLVLAPRHIKRTGSLFRLVQRLGLCPVRFSESLSVPSGWDVLIVDQIGYLPAIYEFAGLVVIGGSFVPRGGHNPLEAAAHDRAIVIGPSTENFRPIIERFEEAGALVRLQGRAHLCSALRELLLDPRRCSSIGRKAGEVLAGSRGCAELYARAVSDLAQRQDFQPFPTTAP